ncbi:MAG: glucosidase, partial [Chlamydiia bacterium]|nr:glucosidase [Chlamydiia bacterium]
MNSEKKRLLENKKRTKYWKRWGPYLAERQWGTVREDYSEDKSTWAYFPYEMALERAYRWGEDGIAGISDTHARLCFALSFWNEEDPFIKERIFGLSNPEGNHGEDVKEYYYYLDNTPTHSYMKYLYKYPQAEYPYHALRKANNNRSQDEGEYELIDTGIFDHNRYYDIFIEYAKKEPEDISIRITVHNRGNEAKTLHVLPTLWARNQWFKKGVKKPLLKGREGTEVIEVSHPDVGEFFLHGEKGKELLFTENETKGKGTYAKDGINEYLVHKKEEKVNPNREGTKGAFHYILKVPPLGSQEIHLRLTREKEVRNLVLDNQKTFKLRMREADEFYKEVIPSTLTDEHRMIARQAYSGMLWNKMYYNLVIPEWLKGDADFNPSLPERDPSTARNGEWLHLYSDDIVSTPDKWEFNMFFSWDTAFHALPLAVLDAEYAKDHMNLLTQEWYMHPNGMLPAYEWNFYDVNPPVHAWSTYRVYQIDKKENGIEDRLFLERVFQKLLMNFTWWVNRKDNAGKNIFQGGFLGLDNISVFNRSAELPHGATLYQSDATSWMGMFCLNMFTIACELAEKDAAYENMANKFYNHFLLIADAINFSEAHSRPLWNEEDGFYYDVLTTKEEEEIPLKVRSLVGLMPLLAVTTIETETLEKLTIFKKKMDWFLNYRQDLCEKVACMKTPGVEGRRLLSIVDRDKLTRLLSVMLDEEEFLSPYGIRSISKYHEKHPFSLTLDGKEFSVDYEPGESRSRLFGGNSNWRGPIWFPLNVLLVESLQRYHYYFGDDLKVECPTGSGNYLNLWDVAAEIAKRLVAIFENDTEGRRPVFGDRPKFQNDPHFHDHILFHGYFHGCNGQGLGANHQTGWTGFIAKFIKQLGE